MKAFATKVSPDDYILSVLSPKDRLDAAFKIAGEAFRKTGLTINDINAAVKKVRKKAHEKER